jgi:hypothetical protein
VVVDVGRSIGISVVGRIGMGVRFVRYVCTEFDLLAILWLT